MPPDTGISRWIWWNMPQHSLSTPEGRIRFDGFLPRAEEIQEIADLMVRFGLAGTNDVGDLVDDRFAREVDVGEVTALQYMQYIFD